MHAREDGIPEKKSKTYGVHAGAVHGICRPLEIKFKGIVLLGISFFQEEVGTERSFVSSHFLRFEWIYARRRSRASGKYTIEGNKDD